MDRLDTISILQVNKKSASHRNALSYNYHFIIKKLAKEFEGQLECLRENIEKQKTFSVSIEKEVTTVDKERNKNIITISYKIEFIDIDS